MKYIRKIQSKANTNLFISRKLNIEFSNEKSNLYEIGQKHVCMVCARIQMKLVFGRIHYDEKGNLQNIFC